jgi:hypothetical protein
MRLDIYRRAEHDGIFSYLAVPEGKPIPQEAINTDWEPQQKALEVADDADALPEFHIEQAAQQISLKGYAITSLKDM